MGWHLALWQERCTASMSRPPMPHTFLSRHCHPLHRCSDLLPVTPRACSTVLSRNSLAGTRTLKPLSTSWERWKQADSGQMSCLFSLDFCPWPTDWEHVQHPARRAGLVRCEMLCAANEFEGKAPRYRLLGGLGQRQLFLWRQRKRWSPEWGRFWEW